MKAILKRLERSRFRNSFKLGDKDRAYVRQRGIAKIRQHALEFIEQRIKVRLKNDGRQTPLSGHPVFKAMHGTATCCRNCLKRWHGVDKDKALNDRELDYFTELIVEWIKKEFY